MPQEQDMLDHLKTLVVSITSNEVVVSCNQTSISNSWMFQQSEKNEASVNSRTFQGPKVITNTNKRKIAKQKWKSEHQSQINASERDRKGRLAACIKKLKEELPYEDIKLQTKENILEESIKYIRLLKAKVEDMLLKDSSENLCAELTNLRKKVNEFEAEKKIYHRILQSHGLLSEDQIKKAKLPIPCFNNRGKRSSTEKPLKVSNLSVRNCSERESTPAARTNCDVTSSHHKLEIKNNNNTESCKEDSIFAQRGNVSFGLRLVSTGMSLPCFDAFHHRSSCAPCSLTYSMARMNANPLKNPILPCLSTIVLQGVTSALPSTNSATTTMESPAGCRSDHTCTSSQTFSRAVSDSKTVLKPSSLPDATGSNSTAAQNACKSSNNEYQSLLSWLRTSDSSADKPRPDAAVLVAFTSANTLPETDKSKTHSLQEELSPTNTSKKDTNSFNIASLMKSSASCQHHSLATAHFPDRDRTPPKDPISESNDYKSVTPKDILHQSFDNDIFECLQNIRGLTTPEPPGRSVEDTNVATTSSSTALHIPSYNAMTFFECSRAGFDVRKQKELSHYECDTIHSDPRRVVVADSGNNGGVSGAHCIHQSGVHSGLANAPSKHHSLRVEKQPHPMYGGPQTPNTQLWQPAITHARLCQQSFSPISHTYLCNSSPQLTLTSTKNPFWMSSTTGNQSYQLPTTDNGVTTTKSEISKKRKLQRSNKPVVKRGKSSPRAGLAQEDAHSISRLIGSSHYPSATSWPPSHACFPGHQRHAAQSCGDERSTTEQLPIFQSGCSSVVQPPCVGVNNYVPQPSLFHSSNVINPQTPYHPPPSGYFPYNPAAPPHSQSTPGTVYIPRFGNTNNNNVAHAHKQHKGSQHHIRQILS